MTDNFDINLDQFQLHDKSEGKIIDIEYTEVDSSYGLRTEVLLSEVLGKSGLVAYTRYIPRNNVVYHHKGGNINGIRTLGKAYKMLSGSGFAVSDSLWCSELMTSLN